PGSVKEPKHLATQADNDTRTRRAVARLGKLKHAPRGIRFSLSKRARLAHAHRAICGLAILASALALRANLSEWVQNLAVDTGLRGVFFRSMALPYGTID